MRTLLTLVPFLLASIPASAQWTQERKLAPADLNAGDRFGNAVSVSGDTVLIGSPFDDEGDPDAGAVYVWVRSGTGWTRQAKLTANDPQDGAHFGYSVALDGDTALIGAPEHDDGPERDSGTAYVFVRSGSTWSEQARLSYLPSGLDGMGSSVALEGHTALVVKFMSGDWGYVCVFVRSGTSWSYQARLGPVGGLYDRFGNSVALSGDRAVVGSPWDDEEDNNAGAVYIYERSGTSWAQQTKLFSGLGDHSGFGWSVGLSGNTLLGSTTEYDQVLAYTKSGSSWSLQDELYPAGTSSDSWFGNPIRVVGNLALIGARNDTVGGSAYVFGRSGTTWSEHAKLKASDVGSGDEFGTVAFDGGTVVIGARFNDDRGIDSGSAYIFSHEPGSGYCFGDPGSGTPCPCGNDNDGSVPGSGCDNGVFSSGARLAARGISSVSDDSVVLCTTGLEPNNTGLYLQGNNAVNGGNGNYFGDGLRCAGGQLQRLQIRFADANGYSCTNLALGARGGVAPGDTRYYQCWYRNQTTPACGLGVNEFNLSNGYAISWGP